MKYLNKLCKCGCEKFCKRNYVKGHNRKGCSLSELTKKKIGETNRKVGTYILSEERKLELKVYRKNKKSHRKGLTLEQEYGKEKALEIRKRSSLSHKNKKPTYQFIKGGIPWNKNKNMIDLVPNYVNPFAGKKHTEKSKEKISLKFKGKKLSKEHIRKSLIRREKSSLEIKFENIIDKNNLPYKFVGNGEFFIERKNPDFVNTNGEKIAIEVYCRKHKEMFRNKTIEIWKQERSEIFNQYGWNLLFFDETQVTEDKVLSVIGGN